MGKRQKFSPGGSDTSPQVMKRRVWKNIIALTTAFTFNSAAYYGLYSIQSSLHKEGGVGTTAASIAYLMFMISCLFLPALLIAIIGQKWVMVMCFISYFCWIAANGVGSWSVMIPASVINGLLDSSLWTAQGSYITEMSKVYAHHSGDAADRICTLFFGIYGFSYNLAGFFSATISGTVLSLSPPENYTDVDDVAETCGRNDCPQNERNSTVVNDPPKEVVWTLVGIYLLFSLCAIMVTTFFLEPLDKMTQVKKSQESLKTTVCTTLLSALRMLKYYRMWLLIAMTWYYAASTAFRIAEFNYSWVTCALGIWMVGYVNVPGYIVSMPTSLLTGIVSAKVGRVIPMTCSLVLNICSISTLYFWSLNTTDVWVYFALGMLFAIHSSILDPVMSSLHGMAFYDQTTAVFACYNFFWALFSALSYGYSYYLCTEEKMYIVTALLFLAFISYYVLEWDFKKRPPGDESEEDNPEDNQLDFEEKKETYTRF